MLGASTEAQVDVNVFGRTGIELVTQGKSFEGLMVGSTCNK